MKMKLCLDCGAPIQARRNEKRCRECQAEENHLRTMNKGIGKGHRRPDTGRTILLTEKAEAGIELARRNMWRRALGLEVLGEDDNA